MKFSVCNVLILVFLAFLLVFTGCPQPPGGEGANSVPVTINAGPNGTVTANPSSGLPGDEISLRVIPDPGYKLVGGSLLANGAPVNTETRKLVIPEDVERLTISASFEALTRVPVLPSRSLVQITEGSVQRNLINSDTVTIGGVRFGMVNVMWPVYGNANGIIFPVTTMDILRGQPYYDNPASFETIAYSFLMGTTEVTYALWHAVLAWNASLSLPNQYIFTNPGKDGSDGVDYPGGNPSSTNPVTGITWYDAVVFCNALTEMYNTLLSPTPPLEYVYYRDEHFNNPVKSARKSDLLLKPAEPGASGTIKTVFARPFNFGGGLNQTTGFRLPTKTEWEYAARIQGSQSLFFEAIQGIVDQGVANQYFTPGSYAAGATAEYKNTRVTGMVAWHGANAGGKAQPVGQKVPTSIGLYDISGNVWEWCYEDSGQEHLMRGGSWRDGSPYLQIGSLGDFPRPPPAASNSVKPWETGYNPADSNYNGIDLTDLTPIPLVTPQEIHTSLPSTLPDSQRKRTPPRQWLKDNYGYDPADPSDLTEYDPMLDPNLSDITTLTEYLRIVKGNSGYSPVGSNTQDRMKNALTDYFTYWGGLVGGYSGFSPTDNTNTPYTSSTTPPPSASYYDPRLNPIYPYSKDYATRYDPRFDPRNPKLKSGDPDYDLAYATDVGSALTGYNDDTDRKGDTIGFRVVRNQSSF